MIGYIATQKLFMLLICVEQAAQFVVTNIGSTIWIFSKYFLKTKNKI
jgi:hypothetical protein